MSRPAHAFVCVGSAAATAGAVHAALNARVLRRPPGPPPPAAARVSLLVPARDEADRIGACIAAARAQRPGDRIEIIVLDDGSTDGTSDAARVAGQADPRVRVVRGDALPDGWLGKPHACAQLAAAADPESEVLVFLDADVRLEAHAVAAAVALLDTAGLDVVCPYPRQLAVTRAERLVQPLLQWSWLTFLPLRLAESSARPSLSAANGQFLVVRRDAYRRAGGHAAVRRDVLDDIALVRRIKRVGGRGGVVDGTRLATCRMYDGWPALRDGYAKSLWAAFGSPGGAAAATALLAWAYLLPPAAALRGSRAGLLGYVAAVAGRVVSARATGGRSWPDAVAHPASVAVLCWLTGRSVVLRRRGDLRWKGRTVGRAG